MEDERLPGPDRGETPAPTPAAGGEAPAPPDPLAEASAPDGAPTDAPPPDEATAETPAAGQPARRGVKLVVTLRPDDGVGYRAVLAFGADGCDPLLRAADVGDLHAALDAVPALLAEAEARWADQPRNPAARPARPARATANRAGAAPTNPPAAKAAAATAQPAGPGQLSLFG